MSIVERLLTPASAELPDCRCGAQMGIAGFAAMPERCDAHIRIYQCASCDHELRLTVWSADAAT